MSELTFFHDFSAEEAEAEARERKRRLAYEKAREEAGNPPRLEGTPSWRHRKNNKPGKVVDFLVMFQDHPGTWVEGQMVVEPSTVSYRSYVATATIFPPGEKSSIIGMSSLHGNTSEEKASAGVLSRLEASTIENPDQNPILALKWAQLSDEDEALSPTKYTQDVEKAFVTQEAKDNFYLPCPTCGKEPGQMSWNRGVRATCCGYTVEESSPLPGRLRKEWNKMVREKRQS